MKPYPAYKPTGLAWLPEVPREWNCRKFKYLFSERSEKGFPNEPLLAATQNHGVILKTEYENRTVTAEKGLETLKLVKVGDFVISLRSFEGGIELSYRQGIISPAYTIIFSNGELTNGYFKWLGKSAVFIQLLKTCVTGIREGQNIDYGRLRVSGVPIPPLAEQEAIVAYLDEKTAKIDRLIELKEREIKLLNEKKQAVISKVVTRGLDPNAELVDSGVDWIGKVPRGWKISRVKNELTNHDYLREPISAENRVNKFALYDYYGASGAIDKIDDYNVDDTVLLIAEDGANLRLRNLPLIYKASGKFWVNNHAHILKVIEPNVYSYMAYALEMADYSLFISGALQPKLTQARLMAMPIAVPPPEEQQKIVAYLDAEGAKTDKAIAAVTRQIGLLKEYRTRLISDAVTGRIDLRKAVA